MKKNFTSLNSNSSIVTRVTHLPSFPRKRESRNHRMDPRVPLSSRTAGPEDDIGASEQLLTRWYSKGFTLIELLVVAGIIMLMAIVAIPGFSKHQALIELQDKSDEIKAGLEGMQLLALNAEQGKTRYYANIDTTNKKVDFGSWTGVAGVVGVVYKTVNLTADQTLAKSTDITNTYLVCDKGKNYCCNVAYHYTACTTAMTTNFFTITNGSKTTTFKIFTSPFRVTTTTP